MEWTVKYFGYTKVVVKYQDYFSSYLTKLFYKIEIFRWICTQKIRHSNLYYNLQNKSIRRIILISQALNQHILELRCPCTLYKTTLKSWTELQNDLNNNESFRNDYTKNQIDVFILYEWHVLTDVCCTNKIKTIPV